MEERYWLTPPEIYEKLNREFHFDFDPCPYPCTDGYDSLALDWGKYNFVNPPFRRRDEVGGRGPTAFVRKAIAEKEKGNTSVLLLPTHSYINLLLEAGAELKSAGRVRWLEVTTREPCRKSPSAVVCAVLRP